VGYLTDVACFRRTLPGFLLSSCVPGDLLRKNRKLVLELFRSISDEDHIHLQETYILAWGQVGR